MLTLCLRCPVILPHRCSSGVGIMIGFRSAFFLLSLAVALIGFSQVGHQFHPALYQNGSPWPRFHQNNQSTGIGVASGSKGGTMWSYATGDAIGTGVVIGSDRTLYVGSYDHNLYALNPDGTAKWTFFTGSLIESTPAIGSDNTIYIGSDDKYLYAVKPDGTQKWKFQTGNSVFSPAIGPDGTIYVGNNDQNLYAVNPDGTQKWRAMMGWEIHTAPAIGSDGTIYIGVYGQNLCAINPDGSTKWSVSIGGCLTSSPAIGSDGTIYIGAQDGSLNAIKPDGTQKWKYTTGNSIFSSPAIGTDGTIYVGSSDNNLYAVTPSGGLKWAFITGGAIDYSSPAIASDGTVYIGSLDGYLYAINADGSQKWKNAIGSCEDASPAIGTDGSVYMTTDDGIVYAIGTVPVGSLSVNPTSVVGGTSSTGTVKLASASPQGGETVTLISRDPSVVVPGSIFVPEGTTSATFQISTNPVQSKTSVVLMAICGELPASATITVLPPSPTSLAVSPTSVPSGISSTGTVTLNGPAPSGGAVLQLSSNSANVVTPGTVTVVAGSTTATFSITTSSVASSTVATISATSGTTTVTASLTVLPATITSLTFVPSTVLGGTASQGKVTFSGPVSASGAVVNLTSNNALAQVPTSITVAADSSTATFSVSTGLVSSLTPCTITATQGSTSLSTALNVMPLAVVSVAVDPSTVTGGTPCTGTVTLNGPAPAGGLNVIWTTTLTLSLPPTKIKIPAGRTSATFSIATIPVRTAFTGTVQAHRDLAYSPSASTSLTVVPATVLSVSLMSNEFVSGLLTKCTVTLTGKPVTGYSVALTSSYSDIYIPSALWFGKDQTTNTFMVATKPVASLTVVTITAILGADYRTATLTIDPPTVQTVAINPHPVIGGTAIPGSITLNGATPSVGAAVTMTSNQTIASVPSSLTFGPFTTSKSFSVTTQPVSVPTLVTITASLNGISKSGTFTVNPPPVTALTVSPPTVTGGTSSTGTVTISSAAPTGGVSISLSSDHGAAQVPASVAIPAGAKTATFTITTTSVTSLTNAIITATLGPTSKTAKLSIKK